MSSDRKLSVEERLKLIQTIGRLPSAQFEQLICALDMPPENKSGGSAAKGDNASSLIGWVESPVGPGLTRFQLVLARVTGQSVESLGSPPETSFTEELGSGIKIEMLHIPGGGFRMGSPASEEGRIGNEGPQRRVIVPAFSMAKYPVTQLQWHAVALLAKVKMDLDSDPSHFKGDNRPVECVSWDDAVEFCARLSKKTEQAYRLPSEAEWEYACRAGTMSPYHFGKEISEGLLNYSEHYKGTTEVGNFPANAFGLYDMHGNVWEWCFDYWHKNYEGAPTDGSAWLTDGDSRYRMFRGGSWFCNPRYCRSASRFCSSPDDQHDNLGFRLVCAAPRTP